MIETCLKSYFICKIQNHAFSFKKWVPNSLAFYHGMEPHVQRNAMVAVGSSYGGRVLAIDAAEAPKQRSVVA